MPMFRPGPVCLLMFLACLALLPTQVPASAPATDPATGRIRIIYLGDAWGLLSPVQYMARDPMLIITPVPASQGHMGGIPDMHRFLRLYLPRTYDDLIQSHDLIVLSDTISSIYKPYHLNWFRDSVIEGGKGIAMVGGREIQTGDWPGKPVEEALPIDWHPGGLTYEMPFRALPTDTPSAFLDSLPFEKLPYYTGLNVAKRKEGTQLLLQADVRSYPVLVFWEVGEGSGLVHTPDWTPAWAGAVWEWDYYADFVANMMYLVARAEIPPDPVLMHNIREEFFQLSIQRGVLVGLAEFVDMFGANTRILEDRLREIDEMRVEATAIYIQQDYEAVIGVIHEARQSLDDAVDLALALKDRALLWIYLTEASAVTATSLICGVVLWTLMVKRRLYREVGTTRSQ